MTEAEKEYQRRQQELLRIRAEQQEQNTDQLSTGNLAASIAFETGLGVATDTVTAFLGWAPPAYALANFASGAVGNLIAQRIRGETDISLGELLASGALGVIPGSTVGKTGKNISKVVGEAGTLRRAATIGGVSGVGAEQIRVGIDEQRLLTPEEILFAGSIGGAMGAGTQVALSSTAKHILKNMKKHAMPVHAMSGSKYIDPLDKPTYDLSELIIPKQRGADKSGLAIMNESGMPGGRLDIDLYKQTRNREAVSIYLTPRGKGVPFRIAQAATIASLNRKFGPNVKKLGLSGLKSLQAHHNVPLKAGLPAFQGLVKDSPKYNKFMQLYYDELLSLGDMPKNIVPALGDTLTDKVSGGKQYNSPHYLIHKFIKDVMGEDGLEFWTPDELDNLVVRQGENGPIIRTINDERRTELIKEQIGLFKRAQDILRLGMEEYRLLGSTQQIMPEEIVEAFTKKLPADLRYEPRLIESIVREVTEDLGYVPRAKPSIQDVFDQQTADLVDNLYKFAVNEDNGEEMLLDVLFNQLTATQAIKKWRKNDPQFRQLSLRFNKALKQAKDPKILQRLRELYQIKQGEIPPADTLFDLGAD